MIVIALDLQKLLKGLQIIVRVVRHHDDVFVAVKFKEIDFVQVAVFVQPVGLQSGFVQLFHLGIEAVILKFSASALRGIFYIQVDKGGA